MSDDSIQSTRESWNVATRAHNLCKKDQSGFLRGGGSTLFPEERDLLGPVRGQHLLHLLCNSGQDTLSWAQLGAAVTGVDLSDEAIATARRLSDESGLPGTFIRSEIFTWLESAESSAFDAGFCSYGAWCWLPDLAAFARGVERVLRPGAAFVTVDFHPLPYIFNEDWQLHYPYTSRGQPVDSEPVGNYVANSGEGLTPMGRAPGIPEDSFRNPHPATAYAWGVADVVGSLLSAGFVLEELREYPYANGCRLLPEMESLPGRRFASPKGCPVLPFMFGLRARKPL